MSTGANSVQTMMISKALKLNEQTRWALLQHGETTGLSSGETAMVHIVRALEEYGDLLDGEQCQALSDVLTAWSNHVQEEETGARRMRAVMQDLGEGTHVIDRETARRIIAGE